MTLSFFEDIVQALTAISKRKNGDFEFWIGETGLVLSHLRVLRFKAGRLPGTHFRLLYQAFLPLALIGNSLFVEC